MARKSKQKTQTQLPDAPLQHVLEVATLSRAVETSFDLQPDPALLERIAAFLGLASLKSLRFKGQIQPRKKENWRVDARLTADLQQSCIVTLEPVAEKVDQDITRDLLPSHQATDTGEMEVELGSEDGPDYFGDRIDIAAIALEELALALDPYPRAQGASLEKQGYAAPGVAPLTDADLKPFAQLADLKEKLAKKGA